MAADRQPRCWLLNSSKISHFSTMINKIRVGAWGECVKCGWGNMVQWWRPYSVVILVLGTSPVVESLSSPVHAAVETKKTTEASKRKERWQRNTCMLDHLSRINNIYTAIKRDLDANGKRHGFVERRDAKANLSYSSPRFSSARELLSRRRRRPVPWRETWKFTAIYTRSTRWTRMLFQFLFRLSHQLTRLSGDNFSEEHETTNGTIIKS